MKRNSLQFVIGLLFFAGLLAILMVSLWPDDEHRISPFAESIAEIDMAGETVPPWKPSSEREKIPPESSNKKMENHSDSDHSRQGIMGWTIVGIVRDDDSHRVPGARIVLYLNHQKLSESVFTDEEGQYAFILEAPAAGSSHLTISGMAATEKYIPYQIVPQNLPAPDDTWPEFRLDLCVGTGVGIYGHVYTTDNITVENCSVNVKEPGGNEWKSASIGLGGFYIYRTQKDGIYDLVADYPGKGISRAVSVFHDAMHNTEAPPLILQEFHSIEGRVTSPDGTPRGNLHISAVTTNHDWLHFDVLYSFPYRQHEPSDLLEALPFKPDGMPYGFVISDRDGRFRISGLRKGRYFLSFAEVLGEGLDPSRIYQTGDRDVRLIDDRYVLKIKLRDKDGVPIPEAKIDYEHEFYTTRGEVNIGGGIITITGGETTVEFGSRFKAGPVQISAETKDGRSAREEVIIHEGKYQKEVVLVLLEEKDRG